MKLAQRIGYVSQQQISVRTTVFDSVLLGRKPYIKWNISKEDIEIVNKAVKALGLEDYSLRYLDELSGGELQKVVIARALAQKPEVLLLDEPTSNLDLKNQLEVIRIIREIVKTQQIAAVMIVHDLNLAIRFADKFVLLKDGSIFAAGGREVMTPENIESVYSVSVAIEKYRNTPVVVPL
ncbi:ABC transporter ATP-binding protein [Clostridium ljungdahlii]